MFVMFKLVFIATMNVTTHSLFCECQYFVALQALCILTNIANGKTAKDHIMGNDDLVGKIVSYLVVIHCTLLPLVHWKSPVQDLLEQQPFLKPENETTIDSPLCCCCVGSKGRNVPQDCSKFRFNVLCSRSRTVGWSSLHGNSDIMGVNWTVNGRRPGGCIVNRRGLDSNLCDGMTGWLAGWWFAGSSMMFSL